MDEYRSTGSLEQAALPFSYAAAMRYAANIDMRVFTAE